MNGTKHLKVRNYLKELAINEPRSEQQNHDVAKKLERQGKEGE